MIKVAKFGGSSLANAEQFKKVKDIITSDSSRKFVINSACGKDKGHKHKVTDLLYLSYAHIKYGVEYDSVFGNIESVYTKIRDDLNLKLDLKKEFDTIKKDMSSGRGEDYLVSRGEYLAGLLLAEYLDAQFIDSKDVIKFDYEGNVDLEKTKEAFDKKYEKGKIAVIPGFYGEMPNGHIKVMSRGGSDVTGSIIARIVNADVYENWTDVSGLLVADPKIIDSPKAIEQISYSELRALSYMGANVLHEETVYPIKDQKIPIHIMNTNDKTAKGTMIVSDDTAKESALELTGISGKKGFTIFNIKKTHWSTDASYLRKVLKVFQNYKIVVDNMAISLDDINVVVQSSSVEKHYFNIINELKETDPENINVVNEIAFIMLVGKNMKSKRGLLGRVGTALGNGDVSVRTVNQGADELSILIGIENKDFENAIKVLYKEFFK